MAERTKRGQEEREREDELLEGSPAEEGAAGVGVGTITRDRGATPVIDEAADEEEDLEDNDDDDEGDVEDDEEDELD